MTTNQENHTDTEKKKKQETPVFYCAYSARLRRIAYESAFSWGHRRTTHFSGVHRRSKKLKEKPPPKSSALAPTLSLLN